MGRRFRTSRDFIEESHRLYKSEKGRPENVAFLVSPAGQRVGECERIREQNVMVKNLELARQDALRVATYVTGSGEQNGAVGAECEPMNSLCGNSLYQVMCIQEVASDEDTETRRTDATQEALHKKLHILPHKKLHKKLCKKMRKKLYTRSCARYCISSRTGCCEVLATEDTI